MMTATATNGRPQPCHVVDCQALLARVAAESERRCPISNLIRDAGVQLQTRWIRETTG